MKFKLENESDYWKKIQEETMTKYGSIDHEVTKLMLVELGVNDRVAFLISEMGFDNLDQVINSDDIERKISSTQIKELPQTVVNIKERFYDLRRRYPNQIRYDLLQEKKALFLENQIFKNVILKPININDQTITSSIINSWMICKIP